MPFQISNLKSDCTEQPYNIVNGPLHIIISKPALQPQTWEVDQIANLYYNRTVNFLISPLIRQ